MKVDNFTKMSYIFVKLTDILHGDLQTFLRTYQVYLKKGSDVCHTSREKEIKVLCVFKFLTS